MVWPPTFRSLAAAAAIAIAVLGVVATGCGGRDGRVLTVLIDERPMTLDPHLQNHSATWSVLMNIYDGLVRFSPEMSLEPSLATSWEAVSTTAWRLQLRQGVHFSNGAPFTADDVVASFERARDHPRSLVRHFLAGITGMRADGRDAVVVETEAAAPDLFNRLAFLMIVPRSDAHKEEIRDPVGTGPYRLARVRDDGGLDLEGWESWRGRPDISRVDMQFDDDEYHASARFFEGGIDVLRRPPDDLIGEIKDRFSLRTIPQPRLSVQLLKVIPGAPGGPAGDPLADPRVRRALLLALDREGWVDRICRGNAVVATQFVHPVVFGYDPSIEPVPYDPGRARELLAEAGFPDGFEVRFAHGLVRSGIVEAISEELERIGLRVVSLPGTFGEALRRARNKGADILLYSWVCTTADASDFLNSTIHSPDREQGLGAENVSEFSDPVIDRLLDRADHELDRGRRLALLQEAQRRTLEALPVLPLTIRWGALGLSDRVRVRARHDELIWLHDYSWVDEAE